MPGEFCGSGVTVNCASRRFAMISERQSRWRIPPSAVPIAFAVLTAVTALRVLSPDYS